jgi:hypothetical protein
MAARRGHISLSAGDGSSSRRSGASAEWKDSIMKLAHSMLLVVAMAASMIAASSSSAAPPCRVIAGPVNQGQTFYGVKCNYPACYCTRRICPMGIQTWGIRLQMKFH